jgi:hypothetical protein
MKYIKDINKFELVTESVGIYDFGVKTGDLQEYYDVGSTLLCSFDEDIIDRLKIELTNFKVVYAAAQSEPFVWLVLKKYEKNWDWIIMYYGDYCYGLFRWEYQFDALNDKLVFVEFCDDIEAVINKLSVQEKELVE